MHSIRGYNSTLNHTSLLQIDETISLPVYKYASMHFLLRCMNDAGVVSMHAQPLALNDLEPISGLQVFDLSLDFDLTMLDDYLTSSNLGNVTRLLHDADVDFTSDARGIAAAVSGIECDQYSWSLQVLINFRQNLQTP